MNPRIDEIAEWWTAWRKRTPPAENPTPDALVLLDEIERLRVENERLRETLQALVDEKLVCNVREGDGSYIDVSAWCRAVLNGGRA